MWPCKNKPKPLTLPASEARVIAQLQQVRVKFEREQAVLNNILSYAKNGQFSTTATGTDYINISNNPYGAHSNLPWMLSLKDVEFLKSLGYVIETKQKPVTERPRAPYMSDSMGNCVKSEPIIRYYTEYLIKW